MAAGQARSRRRPRFYPGPGSPGPAPRRNATDGPSARSPARSAAEAAPGRSSRGGNACSWSKTESDSLRKCHRLLRQAPSVNPRAASKRTIVKPVCAPVARARQDFTRVIRAVFETAFDHHVQIGLKNRIFSSRQWQADARLLPGNGRDIHPDFPLLRQTLPGHCLDLVEGHFDALIALLSGIESRHVVTLYRIEHAVDAHPVLARSEPAQAKGGKAGGRADCPTAHIAEAG